MSMTMTRTQLTLPGDDALPRPVREAVANWRRLAAEQRTTAEHLAVLEADIERAQVADRDALAAALAAGEDDPGNTAVRALEDELAATRRRYEALEHAVVTARAQVQAAIAAAAPEWRRSVGPKVTAARKRYLAAIDDLVAARAALAEHLAVAVWLENGAADIFRPVHGLLPGIVGPNGDPYRFESAVAAMRAIAEKVE